MNITIAKSPNEKKQALNIRSIVFVEEQKVPQQIEIDEHDQDAIHFVGYKDKQAIAASRLRWVDNYGKLERICVIKEYRGESYGTKIIEAMEDVISSKGYTMATLNSQTHAKDFYRRLGYKTVTEEFLDAGIPHITMVKQLIN